MEVDRNRLLHQLDKVCEEKDEEIKQLKQSLYERNIEFDHQMNLAKEEKKSLHDEILDLKSMMAFLKAASENDVQQLSEEKAQLSKYFVIRRLFFFFLLLQINQVMQSNSCLTR
jgi:hypothetical protein